MLDRFCLLEKDFTPDKRVDDKSVYRGGHLDEQETLMRERKVGRGPETERPHVREDDRRCRRWNEVRVL